MTLTILFWIGFAAWCLVISWCAYATKDQGETGATTAERTRK